MVLSRLTKPFSWVFAGHAGFLASQWLMLVVLAKWGSPEFVGSFALALAISSPVIRATGLNFRYVIAASNHPEYSFGDFLGFRLVALGLAIIVLAGGGLLGPIGATTGWTIAIVGLARVFWSLSDVYYGLFLQRDETWAIAASLLLRSVLGLAGLAGGLWLTGGVIGASIGVAVGWLVPVFLVDLPVTNRIGSGDRLETVPRWNRAAMRDLLKETAPLGVLAVLLTLNRHIPKYVVGWELGADELGFYAAIVTLVVPGIAIIKSLMQAAIPRLAGAFRQGDRRGFGVSVVKLCGLCLGLGLGGFAFSWLAGEWVLSTFYGPAYAEHVPVLLWVAGGAVFLFTSWTLDAVLTSLAQFRVQAYVGVLGVVSITVLCLWLVPSMGLIGAAIAWGVSFAVVSAAKLGLVGFYLKTVAAPGASDAPIGQPSIASNVEG